MDLGLAKRVAVVTGASRSVTGGEGSVHHPGGSRGLVVLLAGARTGNVTGSDFVIDGGLIATR